MSDALKKAIDRMPQILVHNAQSMMRRMVASMQKEIAQGGQPDNASYNALLLRVGEADLIREFEAAMRVAMDSIQSQAGKSAAGPASLSLELLDHTQGPAVDEFVSSTRMFSALCAKAQSAGVEGVEVFSKDALLAPLMLAFNNARIEVKAIAELTPTAHRALDAELQKVYGKLDGL